MNDAQPIAVDVSALIDAVFLKAPQECPDALVTIFTSNILERGLPLGPIGIDQCADINRYRLRVIHQTSVSRNDSVPALALVFQIAHDADSTD